MKYRNLLFLLAACCCMGLKCLEPEDPYVPTLPPETQYGANTIGCIVGDHILTPAPNDLGGYKFSYSNNNLGFSIDDKVGHLFINFTDESIVDTGEYDLTTTHGFYHREAYYLHNLSSDGHITKGYVTNPLHTGKLRIKKWDKARHIMAGTFYFHAIASDSQKVLVSNGRFDMRYN